MRRAVGAEPAAVAAHAAPRPVDEDAAARSGVAPAEPRPAAVGNLLEQGAGRECIGELANGSAGAVVPEPRAALVACEPRLGARCGEDRIQLGDRRLLVRGVPRPREALPQATQPIDVIHAGDARRVREAVTRQEALREAEVAEALGIRLELVPRVQQADGEGDAVTRFEGGARHALQCRGHMLGAIEPLTYERVACTLGPG